MVETEKYVDNDSLYLSPLVGTVVIKRITLALVCCTAVLALTAFIEAVGIAKSSLLYGYRGD